MALFHFEVKQISKKNKQGGSKSAAAVIAYRERTKIGKYNYSSRDDFVCSYSIIPPEFADSEYAKLLDDPASFAAEIEKVEKRKDAQLFDEVEISLQHELSLDENIEILNRFLQESYTVRNQFCRVAIHNPDEKNLHAHILVPQRPLIKGENGAVAFGKKLRDDFVRGKPKTTDRLVLMRSLWSSLCNDKFAEKELSVTITHESLKTQHENALLAGDLKKAAETDRPALYLPIVSRKAVTEVIVDSNGDYDFESNKQHLTNTIKAKELDTLTIDFWVRATQFWQNARKLKTNFRLARRKQKQKIQKIITENLINVQNYAIESISTRLDRTHRTISNFINTTKSNTNRIAVARSSSSLAKITKSINQFADTKPTNGFNSGVSNDRSSISENEQRISFNNEPDSTSVANRAAGKTTATANTDYDKLAKELDQALLAKFKQAPSSPRHRI